MNIKNRILSIMLIPFVIVILFTGCISSSSDYSFWQEENQVRLTVPLQILDKDDNHEGITELGNEDLPSKYQDQVKILKEAMISYFEEVYNMDISSELENQKIKIFIATDENDEVMGYVDPENVEYLNLNKALFNEYSTLFDTSYVHESLHQLGFKSRTANLIDEGITDALTDLILVNANIESYVEEDSYAAPRTVGYQILSVDREIANYYLETENPDIIARINQKLENVNQPFEQEINLGERLNNLLSGLTYGFYSETIDLYYIAFEAQEITASYCKTFSPDNQTIDHIRSFYLVYEYEEISITADDEGGYTFNFE